MVRRARESVERLQGVRNAAHGGDSKTTLNAHAMSLPLGSPRVVPPGPKARRFRSPEVPMTGVDVSILAYPNGVIGSGYLH